MRREATLAISAIVVVVALLGVATLAPDALATDELEGPSPEAHLDAQEVTISPQSVGGETVTLSIDLSLRQRVRYPGRPPEDRDDVDVRSENVTVRLRATNEDTGMIADTAEIDVDPIEGEKDVTVTGTLDLEREHDYEIEALIFRDGRRIQTGRTGVGNLDALNPEYADSSIEFARFPGASLPAIGYTVNEASGDDVRIDVSAYLTNAGDGPNDDVEVELIARQTDSNIVADSTRVEVGDIRAGRTETATAQLTVPDGYNYYLDAIIWRDGVIVDSARDGATLNPNTTAPSDDTDDEDDSGVNVGDFETDDEEEAADDGGGVGDDGTGDTGAEDAPSGDGQPGFGIGSVLAALAVTLLLFGRIARERTTTEDDQ